MLSRTQSHRARSPDAGSFFARFAIRSRDGEEADGDEGKKLCARTWGFLRKQHTTILLLLLYSVLNCWR